VFAFINKIPVPENKVKQKENSNHTCLYAINVVLHTNTQIYTHIHTHTIVPENKLIIAKLNRRNNSNHTCSHTKQHYFTYKHTNINKHTQ